MDNLPTNCKFCGGIATEVVGFTVGFDCGTESWIVGEWKETPEHRFWKQSSECKDRVPARLRSLIAEVVPVVEAVAEEHCCVMEANTDDFTWALKPLVKTQAQALLPRLEAEKE